MESQNIYVTTMYKAGDRNCYSYVAFAASSKEEVIEAGESEKKNRSHNYDYEVVELKSGVLRVQKVITKNLVY